MASATTRQIVVVGVDYSDSSDLALLQALEITSTARRAELHAIHVASALPALVGLEHTADPAPPVTTSDEAQRELERHIDRCLVDFASRRETSAPLPERVVAHVRVDAPAEAVAALARELE